jgi:hypothetical protein
MKSIIVLAFTACLASAPDQCREHELVYSTEGLTIQQCQHGAVFQLALWGLKYPDWRVKEYECLTGGQLQVDA